MYRDTILILKLAIQKFVKFQNVRRLINAYMIVTLVKIYLSKMFFLPVIFRIISIPSYMGQE